MKAHEIMTPEPQVLTPDDPVSRAAQLMRERDTGIIPVVEDASSGRLRGVITDRDLAVRHVAEGHTTDCRVGDHMSETLSKAAPEDDVHQVMKLMQREQVRRVPVVDEGGRLVGIISQADLALKLGPPEADEIEETLEEISKPSRK